MNWRALTRLFRHHHESLRFRIEKRVLQYPYGEDLPRGAIARIAKEAGASRSYASKVAHQMGYRSEVGHGHDDA